MERDRTCPMSATRTALHWTLEGKRKRGDQENYGEGQWRASLKPCSRPWDQSRSWPRIDSGGGSLLLPNTPQGVKDNDDGQILILIKRTYHTSIHSQSISAVDVFVIYSTLYVSVVFSVTVLPVTSFKDYMKETNGNSKDMI